MPTPLTPNQWQHVQALLTRVIHQTLHDLADEIEAQPDPLGLRKSMARGLRPDEPFVPTKRDA